MNNTRIILNARAQQSKRSKMITNYKCDELSDRLGLNEKEKVPTLKEIKAEQNKNKKSIMQKVMSMFSRRKK